MFRSTQNTHQPWRVTGAPPTYGYAFNNPVKNTDPDGRGCMDTYSCCVEAAIERGEDPKEKCNDDGAETLRKLKCEEELAQCMSDANTSCPDPGPFSQAKQALLELACKLAYEGCIRGLGKPN